MTKQFTEKTDIQNFLEKYKDANDEEWFYVLFKPISDNCWNKKDDNCDCILDNNHCAINEVYIHAIVHQKILKMYIDNYSDVNFHLCIKDFHDTVIVSSEYIECIWKYENDEQLEKLQNAQNLKTQPSITQPTSFKAGKAVMAIGKGIKQTIIDGAMLGVGKRASKIIQGKIIQLLEKAGVPELVLTNEVFKTFILISGPTALKYLADRFPRLKLNKAPFDQIIDMACISSVADASDLALEQVEKYLKPVLKELSTLIELPEAISKPKKITKGKEAVLDTSAKEVPNKTEGKNK